MQKRFFFFLSLTLPDTSQCDQRKPDFANEAIATSDARIPPNEASGISEDAILRNEAIATSDNRILPNEANYETVGFDRRFQADGSLKMCTRLIESNEAEVKIRPAHNGRPVWL